MVTYTNLYTLGRPAGIGSIEAGVAAGGQITGDGYGSVTSENYHALLWTPSATSGIDLNPSGFVESRAYGTSGTQQVGYGSTALPSVNSAHALLWNSSAASAADLNPSGFTYSIANATSGTQQVGAGSSPSTNNYDHALLWSGSAASYVDLHPNGFITSHAYGISGTQQVGSGEIYVGGSTYHALLWNGSAASAIDLNPSGFYSSYANGTNGTYQVGWGKSSQPTNPHALLWSGSAASYFDLQSVLPASFAGSYASSIDGSSVYGFAVDTSGNYHAIEWTIVPEPGSVGLLGLTMLACAPRRRNARGNCTRSYGMESMETAGK